MALIECPECKTMISEYADKCINCGCPMAIVISKSSKCEDYDLVKIRDIKKNMAPVAAIKKIASDFNIDLEKAKELYDSVKLETKPNVSTANNTVPKCPKCGSTSITAGQRGYKLTTGFLGSNKTVNRCANCGHSWNPGKR